ncbi:PLP-dependent aminotransferase family protein [Viridibacterium curvum]
MPMDTATAPALLYEQIAQHYLGAIRSGALQPGARMPSVRTLTQLHSVSLSTALQACRWLEDQGWLEARPRAGYYVRRPQRMALPPSSEPPARIDATQYLGIHERVSDFIARCELHPVRVNFANAYGSPDAYPAAALTRAATHVLRQHPDLLVTPVPPHGDAGFRSVLARRALDAGMRLTPDDIVVTHGCTEAMNLALRAVTQPGDMVAVESPTFFGLLQILQSLGLRSIEIPTSPQTGISVEALSLALQTQPDIRAVVVVPHFQNPLGSVMPDANKAALAALCAQHDVALIEDDTYAALGDDATPLRALKSWDDHGAIIHCASLHKILAPGMRLGWISGGRWHARIRMLKYAQSRPNDTLAQRSVADYLGSAAYDRHLARLRRLLRTRREQVAEAIATHFPAGTRLTVPHGGMLLWLQLPPLRRNATVFETALREGVRIAPGHIFSNSERYNDYIRLNSSIPFDTQAVSALQRLAEIVRSQLA